MSESLDKEGGEDMKEPQIGIYGFHSKRDKKWYVGQSRDLVKRRSAHLSALRSGTHDNRRLQSGYVRCGEDNFEYMVLSDLCLDLMTDKETRGWLDTTEKLWIQALGAGASGYNQTEGGGGGAPWLDPTERRQYLPGEKFKKQLRGEAYWASLPGQKFRKKRLKGKAYWLSRKRLVVTSAGRVKWGL